MDLNKKRFLSFYLILILLIFLIFIFYFFINKIQKEKIIAQEPISINLLTSVKESEFVRKFCGENSFRPSHFFG